MFGLIKNTLKKIYNNVTNSLKQLFNKAVIDEDSLKELEKILISADTGVHTTRKIIQNLKQSKIQEGNSLHAELGMQLKNLLINKYDQNTNIYLLVGINGSGKTTFASKLASYLQKQNKKVLLVAADTFRAAATEQLKLWANRLNIPVIIGKENQDPSAVVFIGCSEFKTGNYDCLIIDTAGRLQTKTNLMKELEKIKRTINKQLPDKKISTLLTIDSMLGQNSFEQAKIFHECTNIDGIVLTKMDGTAKGGIVFAINDELKIPIAFISFGEKVTDMALFDSEQYIDQILSA